MISQQSTLWTGTSLRFEAIWEILFEWNQLYEDYLILYSNKNAWERRWSDGFGESTSNRTVEGPPDLGWVLFGVETLQRIVAKNLFRQAPFFKSFYPIFS